MKAHTLPNQPLRLLVDGHTFDVGPQGTTTFLAGLLNALPVGADRLGMQMPKIYCACSSKAAAERFLDVPFEHVPTRSGFLRRNVVDLPRASREIMPDVNISQYVRPVWVSGKSIAIIHDVLFLDFPQLFSFSYRLTRLALFGLSAKYSDIVFTVSDYSKERLTHWFRLASEEIRVLPNGVDLPSYPSPQPSTAPNGAVRLLYVSRLEQRKRQDWCIAAIKDLAVQGRPASLDLVGSGSGPFAERIREMVSLAKKQGFPVHLHENIEKFELDNIMRAASLALFPSRCEGFGIPVIEASARGLPCVVADNTALTELRPWFAGAAFASESYPDFLGSIVKMLDGIGTARIEAQRLAPVVQERFSWTAIASQFLNDIAADRAE